MNITADIFTFVQTTFVNCLTNAIPIVAHYAISLLYFFTAFEIVIFGLAFALQQHAYWEYVFLKIIKIGLIFFVLKNFHYLNDVIIQSFIQIGEKTVHTHNGISALTSPASIWLYGYHTGITLLKSASLSSISGFANIQILIGAGLLLVIGLLNILVITQVISFYLVTLAAVIFLPLGALRSVSAFFLAPIFAILKAAIRIMVLIIIINIFTKSLNHFHLLKMHYPYNVHQLLSLFFSYLLFLFLTIYLPKASVEIIDKASLVSPWQTPASSQNSCADFTFVQNNPSGHLSNMQEAANVTHTFNNYSNAKTSALQPTTINNNANIYQPTPTTAPLAEYTKTHKTKNLNSSTKNNAHKNLKNFRQKNSTNKT